MGERRYNPETGCYDAVEPTWRDAQVVQARGWDNNEGESVCGLFMRDTSGTGDYWFWDYFRDGFHETNLHDVSVVIDADGRNVEAERWRDEALALGQKHDQTPRDWESTNDEWERMVDAKSEELRAAEERAEKAEERLRYYRDSELPAARHRADVAAAEALESLADWAQSEWDRDSAVDKGWHSGYRTALVRARNLARRRAAAFRGGEGR